MAYPNDVKLVLDERGLALLKAGLDNSDGEPDYLDEGVEGAIPIADGKYWLLEWDDVRWGMTVWDGRVPQVVAETLEQLDRQELPYSFLRVGEDYTDVEVAGNVPGEAYDMPRLVLKRSIEVEY